MFLLLRNSLEIFKYLTVGKLFRMPASHGWFSTCSHPTGFEISKPCWRRLLGLLQRSELSLETLLWVKGWVRRQSLTDLDSSVWLYGLYGWYFPQYVNCFSPLRWCFHHSPAKKLPKSLSAGGRAEAHMAGPFASSQSISRVLAHTHRRDLSTLGAVRMGGAAKCEVRHHIL